MRAGSSNAAAAGWTVIVLLATGGAAFVPPPRRSSHRLGGIGSSGGNGGDGRRNTPSSGESHPHHHQRSVWNWVETDHREVEVEKDDNWRNALTGHEKKKKNETFTSTDESECRIRGGGSTEHVVKGASATLSSTASFWAKGFKSFALTIATPFRAARGILSGLTKTKKQQEEAVLLEQLRTMPIRQVTIPNTTILPVDVIQIAARRSGLVGQPLRTDRVQDFAKVLQTWYQRHGYVLHRVTGATLVPETGTAEIAVREPATAACPVDIVVMKEMIVTQQGELLTMRQYRDQQQQQHQQWRSRTALHNNNQNLNTTFVPTNQTGRTRPGRIATALQLQPGQPFCWNAPRWQRVANSGVFRKILRATPAPLEDGTVQLQIMAIEAPPRHLEYGVGKSLYTGSWEGELDFEHLNLFGGAETLALSLRRGTKDAMPSVRMRFSDDHFGMEGGYDVEAFSDYIGGDDHRDETTVAKVAKDVDKPDGENVESLSAPIMSPDTEFDCRRGATFRLRNPIDPKLMLNSVASASIERAQSKTGVHESIGSATLGVGPFVRELPLGARSNVDARFMAGTRIASASSDEEKGGGRVRPYSAVTATTRQVFPLLTTQSSGSTRPIILALKHSATTSTKSLPQHEARAQGISCTIRGVGQSGKVSTALCGSTELRIPIQLPIQTVRQDASVVLFGDWIFAKKDASSTFCRKSSVGLGLRKSLQGVPAQYNLSYSEGKLKATFGLGRDFEV
jgi:hypothetical protein